MAKIKVKAAQAVLGIRAGETGEVEDTAYVRKAIAAGRLALVDDAPAAAAKTRPATKAEPSE